MTVAFQADRPELILASASAARAGVLRSAGLRFSVCSAAIDESAVKDAAKADGASADDTAILLADLKAQRIARSRPDSLVLGADQILVCEGCWFDKPRDMAEARDHLVSLRGRVHHLATALVCRRAGTRVFHHVSRPRLTMRPFSDDFLDAYLAHEGDAVLSSVGAYRVEELGIHLFDEIEGEHSAVLGLPLRPLLGFLRQHGVVAG